MPYAEEISTPRYLYLGTSSRSAPPHVHSEGARRLGGGARRGAQPEHHHARLLRAHLHAHAGQEAGRAVQQALQAGCRGGEQAEVVGTVQVGAVHANAPVPSTCGARIVRPGGRAQARTSRKRLESVGAQRAALLHATAREQTAPATPTNEHGVLHLSMQSTAASACPC